MSKISYKAITKTRDIFSQDHIHHNDSSVNKYGIFIVLQSKTIFEFSDEASRQKFLENNHNKKHKVGIFTKILKWFLGFFIN